MTKCLTIFAGATFPAAADPAGRVAAGLPSHRGQRAAQGRARALAGLLRPFDRPGGRLTVPGDWRALAADLAASGEAGRGKGSPGGRAGFLRPPARPGGRWPRPAARRPAAGCCCVRAAGGRWRSDPRPAGGLIAGQPGTVNRPVVIRSAGGRWPGGLIPDPGGRWRPVAAGGLRWPGGCAGGRWRPVAEAGQPGSRGKEKPGAEAGLVG